MSFDIWQKNLSMMQTAQSQAIESYLEKLKVICSEPDDQKRADYSKKLVDQIESEQFLEICTGIFLDTVGMIDNGIKIVTASLLKNFSKSKTAGMEFERILKYLAKVMEFMCHPKVGLDVKETLGECIKNVLLKSNSRQILTFSESSRR